jgi:hypothetical protein
VQAVQRRLAAVVGHLLADVGDTARSMLRRVARSPGGAHRAGRLDNAVRVTPAMPSISASTSARRTSSRFFSINRSCSISVLTLT